VARIKISRQLNALGLGLQYRDVLVFWDSRFLGGILAGQVRRGDRGTRLARAASSAAAYTRSRIAQFYTRSRMSAVSAGAA
jgi:hypothetical protein